MEPNAPINFLYPEKYCGLPVPRFRYPFEKFNLDIEMFKRALRA